MIIAAVIAVLLGMFFFMGKGKQKQSVPADSDTIVKDNVKVLTSDMSENELPAEVTDDRMVFEKNPKYKKGDVIVAGCIPQAENGFIRRVIQVEKADRAYIFYTEPAVLTDVFEKAHIVKRFYLTEDEIREISYQQIDGLKMAVDGMNEYQKLSAKSEKEDTLEPNTDYMLGAEFNISKDGYDISGEAGINVWLELNIDIKWKQITCSMALKSEGNAEVSAGLSKSLIDSKENIPIEEVIFWKRLPNGEFLVGGVPIVFTNEVEVKVEAEAEIEGSIGLSYSASFEGTQGFEYDSKKGKVEELNEFDAETSGMEWKAVEVSVDSSAGVGAHLIVKLYGCSGIDAAIGVYGEAEGNVKLSSNSALKNDFGELDLEIGPEIKGTLVVDIPVCASGLIEQPLFTVQLPPFWEGHWPTEEGFYMTRWGQVNQTTYPTFQFKMPKGWEVTTEEIEYEPNPVREHVEMENNEGLTVAYWDFSSELGMYGHMASWAEITKVADSEFEPGIPEGSDEDYSYIGKMMVAKIHVTKEMGMTDQDWVPADWTFYAVLPESFAKEIDFAGLSSMLETFSFRYPHYHVFLASAPDGTFTKEQEAEVIDILKSFTTTSSIY